MKLIPLILSFISANPDLNDIPDEAFVPLTLREDIRRLYQLSGPTLIPKEETDKFIKILEKLGETLKYPTSTKEESIVFINDLVDVQCALLHFEMLLHTYENNKEYKDIINLYTNATMPRMFKIKEDLEKQFNILEADLEELGCVIS